MPSGHAPQPLQITVLVGESTRMHSQLLAEALGHDRGLRVIGAVSTGKEFLEVARHRLPDVVVVSAGLDDDSLRGLETLREFHGTHPEVPAVVLLDSARREVVLDAFRCGARGIFSKNESLEHLRKCVRSVYQGQVWASSREVRFVLEALCAAPTIRTVDANGLELLSAREREVVHYLAEGLTNREIGARMQLSPHTIKNYLLRVFEKLGVSSRMELLRMTLTQTPPADPPSAAAGSGQPSSSALEWCQRAAEQGIAYAQLLLAESHRDGAGCARDLAAAYFWYCLCEQTGSATFAEIRAEKQKLTESLSRTQIDDAHARVEQWLNLNAHRKTRPDKASRRSDSALTAARDSRAAYGD